MHQQVDSIIARFGQSGWLVQKTKENFWALRPQGTFNYKVFLMTYNPITTKFQIVKPPSADRHYDIAVRILEASDRQSGEKSDRSSKVMPSDLSIIKVPSMFPIKLGRSWINLAQIQALTVIPPGNGEKLTVVVRWDSGEEDDFHAENAEQLLAEYEKAAELIWKRFGMETA